MAGESENGRFNGDVTGEMDIGRVEVGVIDELCSYTRAKEQKAWDEEEKYGWGRH